MKIKSTVWQVLAAGSFGAGLLYALGIEGTAQVGGTISDSQFITAMALILAGLALMRLGAGRPPQPLRQDRPPPRPHRGAGVPAEPEGRLMASNSKTYTRIRVDCGKVMQQVYQTKMRCPECAAQRKRLLHAQWQARHKEEIRSLTPRPSSAASRLLQAEARDIAFRADVRAADAAGLSYGQYMARKASKKPAGVGAPTSCKG